MPTPAEKNRLILRLKELVRLLDSPSIDAILGEHSADGDSDVASQAFYGKLLFVAQRWEEAYRVLEAAWLRNPDERVLRDLEVAYWMLQTRDDLRGMQSGVALSYLLAQPQLHSVLDVGSGGGEHALQFALAGKQVHCVDFGVSVYARQSKVLDQLADMSSVRRSIGDFMELQDVAKYDLVWCSHVLEHQPNANLFLKRCFDLVADEGWLAITVPPLKHPIVGGHVSLWNAGLVLYQMVLAGNDCSDAVVMNYGYNISVLVRRRPIIVPALEFDSGDIGRISRFLPAGCSEGFDGRMVAFSGGKPQADSL